MASGTAEGVMKALLAMSSEERKRIAALEVP